MTVYHRNHGKPGCRHLKTRARSTGRVLSGLVIVFLLFDGAIKLVPWPIVTETMDKMGYGASESLARSLGLITIVCTALYAVPPTSILGAILLTGYLGGAMASHVRIGSPLVHPHPVRALSRPDGVGRAVAARQEPAFADTFPPLTCQNTDPEFRHPCSGACHVRSHCHHRRRACGRDRRHPDPRRDETRYLSYRAQRHDQRAGGEDLCGD